MERKDLEWLIGRMVRVDRGGPESRLGKLLSVKDDHIVIHIEDEGMLYYKNDHIKSFSIDTRDVSDLAGSLPVESAETPPYVEAADFVSVLQKLKHRWCQFNRGGSEKIEGVMVDANADQVTIIKGNEIVQIVPYHIRSVSYGIKNENKEEKNEQERNKNDKNDKNDKNEKKENNGKK